MEFKWSIWFKTFEWQYFVTETIHSDSLATLFILEKSFFSSLWVLCSKAIEEFDQEMVSLCTVALLLYGPEARNHRTIRNQAIQPDNWM